MGFHFPCVKVKHPVFYVHVSVEFVERAARSIRQLNSTIFLTSEHREDFAWFPNFCMASCSM